MWSTRARPERRRRRRSAALGRGRARCSASLCSSIPTAPLYALTAFGVAARLRTAPPASVVRQAWPGAVALLVTFVPVLRADAARARRPLRRRLGRDARADVLRPARVGGRAALRRARAGTTSTTSRCSRRRRRRRSLVRRAYRTLALLRADRRGARRVLLRRAGERRLGALLRPLHDPRRRRRSSCSSLAGLPRDRALGGRAAARRARAARRRPRSASRCATTSTIATRSQRIGVDAVVARGRARAARDGALRLDGNERRDVLVVRLRPPGEHPRPPGRASRALRAARRRRLVRARRCRSSTRLRRRRVGVWLFYAASPGEAAPAAPASEPSAARGERVGGHYFVVRSTTALALRAR